jgi:hypothetical protein
VKFESGGSLLTFWRNVVPPFLGQKNKTCMGKSNPDMGKGIPEIGALSKQTKFHCSPYSYWFAKGSYPGNPSPYICTTLFMLRCLAYSCILKTEAVCSSETSVYFY